MNKILEAAYDRLLREHPDLAQDPLFRRDPDARPPNEESLDELTERGEQFDGNLQDWWAHADPDNPLHKWLTAWIDTLNEPNKTIFVLFLRRWSEREIVLMLKWQGVCRNRDNVHDVIKRFRTKLKKNKENYPIHY